MNEPKANPQSIRFVQMKNRLTNRRKIYKELGRLHDQLYDITEKIWWLREAIQDIDKP